MYAKPPLTTSKAWIPRKMVGHAGPRSYLIDTGKSRISQNRVQVQLAPPRSDSSNSSFYSRAERTLRDQLLPNSITVTTPISQTPARSMEIPLSPAPAYIETSLCCAMLSPTPPLISPVPPSPGLPKSQTVKQLLEVIELLNVRLGILINYAMYCISCYRCRVPIYGNVQPILTFKSSDNTLRWDH